MSVKEIKGLMTILPDVGNGNQSNGEIIQAGNVAFRNRTLQRTLYFWDNNSSSNQVYIALYPWKQGGMLEDADINVGHSMFWSGITSFYPWGGPSWSVDGSLSSFDYGRFRSTGTVSTITAANMPRVIGGIGAMDGLANAVNESWGRDSLVSASDLPADYTQIGTVYAHPMFLASTSSPSSTLTTAVGLPYVTFVDAQIWDQVYTSPARMNVVRIASGADAGCYFVQNVDYTNNRLYLRNLDGSTFVGQAAATIAATDCYFGPGRIAYFNETSIIPFSTGLMVPSGRYIPGLYPGTTQPLRTSFICRVKVEKTGSTEVAAAAEQQGSYTFTMKPWTHGSYDTSNGYEYALTRPSTNEGGSGNFINWTFPFSASGGGGSNALLLDEVNQRVWIAHTNDANNSLLGHWRWRTLESPREVANYLGTAGHASFLTPTPALAVGDRILGGALDSKQWAHFAVFHSTAGNGGVIIIKPDLTTLQYSETAPSGTGDTIGGTAPNMTLTDSGAFFVVGQVGQSITISGATTGANNGTFVITGYTSPTQITYQNRSGIAEAFTGTWTVLGVPDSRVAGIVADKTRTRVGNSTSTNGSDLVTTTTGAFTTADEGRVIKLTGLGVDSGLYKIKAPVTPGNSVNVTTLADAVVTFTSQSGGSFEIGDRMYMFYANTTNGLNKINYMEHLAPGTFLTRTFSSTAGLGADCNTQNLHGENQKISIDPANGNVYWLSKDTTQQINKYDVATNAHTAIPITSTGLLSPAGQVLVGGTAATSVNPQTPTYFNAILVNSKFDDIWVGTDAGIFRIVKSTFATTSIKRYWGADQTPYYGGTALTTNTGNGASGIAGTAPTMTLNTSTSLFVASDVGKYIVITGASSTGNNGYFPITAFNSSTSITYTNASGVAQSGYVGTAYVVASIFQRSNGNFAGAGNTNIVRNFWEHPDGKTQVGLFAGATNQTDFGYYCHESDAFSYRASVYGSQSGGNTSRNKVFDSLGWFMDFQYNAWNAGYRVFLGAVDVQYQWTGSAWIPLEVALNGTPNKSLADTTNPLCAARPIHSTAEDLMYGVKIQFNRQGGATPANNEFLGRMGQTRVTASDGATIATSNVFNGSGFVAGDTGRLLRIESGTSAGVYKATFVNSGQLTLKTMAGATFSALNTAGTLTYTVWDFGAAGSNAGPEDMCFILADGVSKDNTQDISGFTYETFHFKTRLHENDEARKFCVENPLAAPGALATKVYWENYPRQTRQYDAAITHHRALPAAEHPNGRQVVDGVTAKLLDGTVGKATIYSNTGSTTDWSGITADSRTLGWSLMVDFGADVQVGHAIIRMRTGSGESRLMSTNTNSGMRAAVYKATDAGGTPAGALTKTGVGNGTTGLVFATPTMTLNSSTSQFVVGDVGKYIVITGASLAANNGTFLITAYNSATSVSWTNASGAAQAGYAGTWYVTPTANVRTSGTTNFNCTANTVNTLALGSAGTFLGPTTLTPGTPAVGQIGSGFSTLTDTTNSPFLASHVGQILTITGLGGPVSELGSYRIMSVTSSSVIVIRNLDQTAKTWGLSNSTVTYYISDGVREEDMIVVANGSHLLCVERLLTTNTLQLRTPPNGTISSQSWICVKPTWDLVKKVSYMPDAQPPDVANNGTWISSDGLELNYRGDIKMMTDFNDLSAAQRTGRYWKFAAMPRFDSDASRADHWLADWEFYDTSGKRIATSNYTLVDQSRPDIQADFFFTHLNRFDFIQSANDALTGVASKNGNANLSDATITLTTGGNKFLGFQIGPTFSDGNPVNGSNVFNSLGSAFPASATAGRFLWIQDGTNAGYYRILARTSATQLTVLPPSGVGSTVFSPSETGRVFSIHEGINVGGSYPDKFVFLSDGKEFSLATINDALTSITINETGQPARTNGAWEIRRPGYGTSSATTDATKTARIVSGTFPVQSGDMFQDSRGCLRLFAEDIGTGFQRADGVVTVGTGNITGSGFTQDDVGRLLYIISGTATQTNNGIYEISAVSGAVATVKSHYTGLAVSFAIGDAGPVTYQVYGDRRYRLTRLVVGLKA